MWECEICGMPFFISVDGTAHHWGGGMNNIDHNLDSKHVPYSLGVET